MKGMLKIAIVEDEPEAAQALLDHLSRYQKERGGPVSSLCFRDGVDFLEHYRPDFDVVFMDIEMPFMDGMKTAAGLRRLDESTCLIFVTNMAQFAIKGYEVDALDFLLKPVPYAVFAYKLDKAVAMIQKKRGREHIVKTKDGLIRMQVPDIYYVEAAQHRVIYHTAQGVVEAWSSLSQVEAQLKLYGFSRCNACFLVNLRYAERVEDSQVYLRGEPLKISRSKKSQFLQDLARFLGV